MALDPVELQLSLLDVFNTMFTEFYDDRWMCDEIGNAYEAYINGGIINTVDAGPIAPGVYAGAGVGEALADGTIMADILYAACQAMAAAPAPGSDVAILAPAFGAGLTAMCAAATTHTQSTGIITPPTGSTVPWSGPGVGVGIVLPAAGLPLTTAAAAAFVAMVPMTAGGDAFMAAQLAAGTTAAMLGNVITVAVATATGVGTMT